jgi:plasmid stabilization system protein ParE
LKRNVEWTSRAKKALDYYCAVLPESAEKNIRSTIISTSKKLSDNPYLFQIDEYYPGNDGSIRRFFKWNFRVVYQVEESRVIILNIFHTSQKR